VPSHPLSISFILLMCHFPQTRRPTCRVQCYQLFRGRSYNISYSQVLPPRKGRWCHMTLLLLIYNHQASRSSSQVMSSVLSYVVDIWLVRDGIFSTSLLSQMFRHGLPISLYTITYHPQIIHITTVKLNAAIIHLRMSLLLFLHWVCHSGDFRQHKELKKKLNKPRGLKETAGALWQTLIANA